MLKRVLIVILCFSLLLTGLGILDGGCLPASAAGEKIIVGIAHDPPFAFRNEQGKWVGIMVDFWYAIAQELKIDYSFKEMTPEEILEALRTKTIDFSCNAIFMTEQREKSFEFTVPVATARIAVATLHGEDDHPWMSAVKIFFSWGTIKMLIALLIILVLLGFIFWFIERDSNAEHFGAGLLKGVGSGVYWVGSTMASGVCFGVSLKSLAGRILGLLWMLVCALALSAFIASLTSSLTTNRMNEQKITGDNLRSMHLGTEAGTVPASVIDKIGSRITYYKDEEAVLRALMGRKIDGFIYDEATLQYYAEGKYRGIITVHPTSLRELVIAYGIPNHSPLRKPVNQVMLKVLDEPLWESILGRYGLDNNFEAKPILGGRAQKRRVAAGG
ncbi:MAG: hypothetical protein CSYNP_01963 [Syntrophus sp. SKADARSKE-3]|nr:hypothetical protein [Syntrophus sp. SKADARSKE-3]